MRSIIRILLCFGALTCSQLAAAGPPSVAPPMVLTGDLAWQVPAPLQKVNARIVVDVQLPRGGLIDMGADASGQPLVLKWGDHFVGGVHEIAKRHFADVVTASPTHAMDVLVSAAGCRASPFKSTCTVTATWGIKVLAGNVTLASSTEAFMVEGLDARTELDGNAASDPAAEAQRRQRNGLRVGLRNAIGGALARIDEQLTKQSAQLALDPKKVTVDTLNLVRQLVHDDVCAALVGRTKAQRAVTPTGLTGYAYVTTRSCAEGVRLPMCLKDQVSRGLLTDQAITALVSDTLLDSFRECGPKIGGKAVQYGIATPVGSELIWVESHTFERKVIVDAGPEIAFVQRLGPSKLVLIALPWAVDLKDEKADLGGVYLVSLAAGKSTKIQDLDRTWTQEALGDVKVDGSGMTIRRNSGKPIAVALPDLAAPGDWAWTQRDDLVDADAEFFKLRAAGGNLVPVAPHRTAKVKPLIFTKDIAISPPASLVQAVEAATMQDVWNLKGTDSRNYHDVMTEFNVSSRASAMAKEAYSALAAWTDYVGEERSRLAEMDEIRESAIKCNKAQVLIARAQQLMRSNKNDAAAPILQEANSLCADSEAGGLLDEINSASEAKDAAAAEKREAARRKRIMASVPMLKARCIAAHNENVRAQQYQRMAATSGQVSAVTRAEQMKQRSANAIRSAQAQLLEAIQIYRAMGLRDAADTIQRDSSQCLGVRFR